MCQHSSSLWKLGTRHKQNGAGTPALVPVSCRTVAWKSSSQRRAEQPMVGRLQATGIHGVPALYALQAPLWGRAPATWCSFQAWIGRHSEQGTTRLLWHFVYICNGERVSLIVRRIPWNSWKVKSETRDKLCAGTSLSRWDSLAP